jgi:putative DNA primase/helicase
MDVRDLTSQELRGRLYEDRRQVHSRAHGLWPDILSASGIAAEFLRLKKGGPCPFCSGRDRYAFTNYRGEGFFHCRHCGAGDGVTFLMRYHRWTWWRATGFVLEFLQDPSHRHLVEEQDRRIARAQQNLSESDVERRRRRFKEVWNEASPVTLGDPVHRYLTRRVPGLQEIPKVIRFHPALPYYWKPGDAGPNERPVLIGRHPGMLAVLQDIDGRVANVHRTWLTGDGQKAKIVTHDGEILDSRKLMPSVEVKGAAIRLAPGQHRELGVAEGIETSFAAQVFAGVPTWPTVSTGGMRSFVVPEWVEILTIFADNDTPKERIVRGPNGDEQRVTFRPGFDAANDLAKRPDIVDRIKRRTLRVNVRTPSKAGTDIADLLMKLAANRQPWLA